LSEFPSSTCLGCGCACDDIVVEVRDGRIVEARNACELGKKWFGDGKVSGEVRVRGKEITVEEALDAAAELLGGARRALVYLAPDISCETQRAAVALGDHLRGVVDSVTSSTVAGGTLAAQRRGRPTASLGEIRNRAELLVFWGVDPAERYPRFPTRYAPDPGGIYVPGGRADRTVVAVDIGDERGPRDADVRIALAPGDEQDALAQLRAATTRRVAAAAREEAKSGGEIDELSSRFDSARYAVIVYDAEPRGSGGGRDGSGIGDDGDNGSEHAGGEADDDARRRAWRAESLIALAQQLNAGIRCSVLALRAGGNRNGAEAVLTWQTGFPMTVDYSRGAPRYRPDEGAAALARGGAVDAILIVGNARAAGIPPMAGVPRVVIGPWASRSKPAADVAIDTGVAGIHEGGMAFRMDDIPLPLRPSLPGPSSAPETAFVIEALHARIRARARGNPSRRAGGSR